MSTGGLITMLVVWAVVATMVTYFFLRVLRTPPKPDEDVTSNTQDS